MQEYLDIVFVSMQYIHAKEKENDKCFIQVVYTKKRKTSIKNINELLASKYIQID